MTDAPRTEANEHRSLRVKPSLLLGILIMLGYVAVVFTVWSTTGLHYDTVGNTVSNVQKGITLAIGLGSLYLVVVTTALGWWTPALREPRRAGSRWMWSIPVVLMIGAVVNLAGTKWSRIDHVGSYVFWLALGCVFVGFSEEMVTRGLLIVGARGNLHEKWVWAVSGLCFGLLHVPNAFYGQSAKATAQQVAFAFLVGLTYYVTRRVSGTLVVTMVLHAIWDFSVFIQEHSVHNLANPPKAVGGSFMFLAIGIGIVALVKILKSGDVVEPGGDQLAAFASA